METLLDLKKAIPVAKTVICCQCRHSLPKSKVLSPRGSFGEDIITKILKKEGRSLLV